ncbi:MAG: hypothetical protein U0797_09850 [Gemmataceae bacterium]
MLAAADRGEAGGVYNVSDGSPVRRRDFYARLAGLLERPAAAVVPPPDPVPASERVNRRVLSRRLRDELGFRPKYPSYVEGLAASL